MPEASVIRRMFEGVAPRYDLLNRVLSLGIDRSWRRSVVETLALEPHHRVLDLCCGTGDLALEIAPRATCIGCDFTWSMLTRAQLKARRGICRLHLAAADALELPFGESTFDRLTIGFGIRNLQDMPQGLAEMYRVLRHGGLVAILEFSHPTGTWLRVPYRLYLERLLPSVGQLLSRRGEAYRYLAESIGGFPEPRILTTMLERAGFTEVSFQRRTGGIVAIHRARKPQDDRRSR